MNGVALTAGHLVVIGKGRLIADTRMAEFMRASPRTGKSLGIGYADDPADVLPDVGSAVPAQMLSNRTARYSV
jgi:ABC-2 type transport system ATP-binding protein